MSGSAPASPTSTGLLVDTNLLVLLTIGAVNRKRIEEFKRTRQYSEPDFDLLVQVLGRMAPLYTVAHVMAEVSNLIDLPGWERVQARKILTEVLTVLQEPVMPSVRAAKNQAYENHGLSDAS